MMPHKVFYRHAPRIVLLVFIIPYNFHQDKLREIDRLIFDQLTKVKTVDIVCNVNAIALQFRMGFGGIHEWFLHARVFGRVDHNRFRPLTLQTI